MFCFGEDAFCPNKCLRISPVFPWPALSSSNGILLLRFWFGCDKGAATKVTAIQGRSHWTQWNLRVAPLVGGNFVFIHAKFISPTRGRSRGNLCVCNFQWSGFRRRLQNGIAHLNWFCCQPTSIFLLITSRDCSVINSSSGYKYCILPDIRGASARQLWHSGDLENKKTREDAMCLRSHDQNLQYYRLGTSFELLNRS